MQTPTPNVAPSTEKGRRRYRPARGSKRWYVFESMKKGGTPTQIHERAAVLAQNDGLELRLEDFDAVNVNFLAVFLQKKGYGVTHRRDTVRIS
jgi:hypothetical protein